jgi:hypothetical protein
MLLAERWSFVGFIIGPLLVLVGSIGSSLTMPPRAAVLLGLALLTLTLVSPFLLLDNPFLEIPNIHSGGAVFVLLIPVGLFGGVFLEAISKPSARRL